MRPRRLLNLFILFLFVFLLGGCSIYNGGGVQKSNTGGDGLDVSFSIDTRFIPSTGLLYGVIKLKNTGFKDIKLSPDSIELSTTTKDLFKEDPDVVLKRVLSKYGEITLVQGAEPYTFSFQIPINKKYVNDIVNSYGDLSLKVSYLYKTVIDNNIKINVKNPTAPVSFLDSYSQAAPVRVSKVDSILVEGKKVQLNFYFSKVGEGMHSYVDDFKYSLSVGGVPLNCDSFNFSSDKPLICKFEPKADSYNTILSGVLNYRYTVIVLRRIDLHQLRDKMRGY